MTVQRKWLVLIPLVIVLGLVGVTGAAALWFYNDPAGALRTLQSAGIDSALGPPEEVDTERGPIMVWRIGEGSGPTTVLLHGFGDAAAGWTSVAQELAKDRPVVLFDLPGHGRSAPLQAPLRYADLMNGVEAVLGDIDGPVVLIGNSLGGWLSAAWAELHPDRVASLVLLNSAGFATTISRDVLLPTTRDGVAAKNRIILGENAPRQPDVILDGLIEMQSDARLQGLFDDLMQNTPNLDGRVAKLSHPVRLVWGTPDPFFPVKGYLDRIQSERPDAPTHLLEGCGHAPQYSCATELVAVLRED